MGFVAMLMAATPAAARWKTLEFDLTRLDEGAYTTDLPAEAFTPQGLMLELEPGRTYRLMSREMFGGDYDLEMQIEVVGRSGEGEIQVDLILENERERRRAVGRYGNQSPEAGTDSLMVQYFKEGTAQGMDWRDSWRDFSSGGTNRGQFEWLRMHKTNQRLWFMGRLRGVDYAWGTVADHPGTSYFDEDCDEYRVGFEVRATGEAAGTLHIRTMRLRGDAVVAASPQRVFLFDFGPVNQQLEDDFTPVSEYSTYRPEKGYGWVIEESERERVWRGGVPGLSDREIAEAGLPALRERGRPGNWRPEVLARSYWMQVHDRKWFYSQSHGNDWVEFYQQWLDLKTPLERDFVGMARSYQFQADPDAPRDIDERRGALYVDDDLATEFVVDLPNGRYNVIIGVGFSPYHFAGSNSRFNVEIQGRVRQKGLNPSWRRPHQHPVRNVIVEDGQMRLRFFADVRRAMDTFSTTWIGTGWQINYLVILPAEERELMSEWEWRIIRRRGEIIRRVTFVEGDVAVTRNEGNFISLNGKPWYFLKVMSNYHPGTTEHFPYYSLANHLSSNHAVSGSQHFFKPDWERLSFSDDYPWAAVDRMNVAFRWRMLTTMHQEAILSFVPRAVSGEGSPTVDSRGRTNRYNVQPPLNSALGKEIQRQAYTMVSNQLATHPGLAGHFVYEELWHPNDAGYEDQSLIQFQGWLERKYGDIATLNREWGREYTGFDQIVQPVQEGQQEFWQYTPEFVNFRKFRGWAQREMVRSAFGMIRENEPFHFAWGAKGDFGTQSFYTGEFLDMFGWYTPYTAASVARHFGRAAISGGYLLNCEHVWLDGRRQADHEPGNRSYPGRAETAGVYNKLISSAFKGSKGFYSEWYSNAMSHAFHRTTLISNQGPRHRVRHWTGQIAFYEQEAYEGPPVRMERSALYAGRANEMLYRLSQLWLPAEPLRPRVLIPTSEASFWMSHLRSNPGPQFEQSMTQILRSSNVPVDILALHAVEDLSQYRLIILGDVTQAIPRGQAERLVRYVEAGGKLIIMNGGGFTEDERPRRYNSSDVFPIEALAELGGYRLVAHDRWHLSLGRVAVRFAGGDVAPDFADQEVGAWETSFVYEPLEGSRVFLRGELSPRGGGASREVVMGLLNAAGNVAVVNFPPGGEESAVRPLSRWFARLLEQWEVDGRMSFADLDDAWGLYSGMLKGEDYMLVAVCNEGDEPRRLSLRLGELAAGEYAVMDVTGEAPELERKADGGWTLRSDPAAREMRIMARLSDRQLAEEGLAMEVGAGQARVFLVRPTAEPVWVSIWRPVLHRFTWRPVTVAYGDAAEDREGAEAIAVALRRHGAAVTVLPADEVSRQRLVHEVRIKPDGVQRGYREDMSQWYLVDRFENEVLDTDNSIILVGSDRTNSLLKHLGSEGTFAYDKVLEKITAEYPGPGRGVIGFIDAVNSPVYDANSHARDGIVVGGSDAAGTRAAVVEMVRLIDRYPPQAPPPVDRPMPGPAETTDDAAERRNDE